VTTLRGNRGTEETFGQKHQTEHKAEKRKQRVPNKQLHKMQVRVGVRPDPFTPFPPDGSDPLPKPPCFFPSSFSGGQGACFFRGGGGGAGGRTGGGGPSAEDLAVEPHDALLGAAPDGGGWGVRGGGLREATQRTGETLTRIWLLQSCYKQRDVLKWTNSVQWPPTSRSSPPPSRLVLI